MNGLDLPATCLLVADFSRTTFNLDVRARHTASGLATYQREADYRPAKAGLQGGDSSRLGSRSIVPNPRT
jgi:hypothetical protein